MILKRLFLSVFPLVACCCTGVVYADVVHPNNCAPGKYWDSTTNGCEACPMGYYCQDDVKRLCEGATYSELAASYCEPCIEYPYANETHTGCTPCNTGAVMENGEGVCIMCSDPQRPYANVSHTGCVACAEANEFVIEDGTVCKLCPDETPYMNPAMTQCMNCTNPQNGICYGDCEQNEYLNELGECVACPVGYYINDLKQCVICDAGYYCTGDGSRKLCASGGYSEAGQSACTRCPAGYYINDAKELVACDAGYYCTGDGSRKACSTDSFSATGQKSCSKCPDGYVKSSTNTEYTPPESLDNLCKKIEIKLKIGTASAEVPKCLKPGKINSRVVRQR